MKILNLKLIFFITGVFPVFFSTCIVGQNLISKKFENHYRFGKYLFSDNDFERAISELNKALFFNEFVGFNKGDSIHYLIGVSYTKIGDYNLSNRYLSHVSNNDSTLYGNAVFQSSKNYFLKRNYDSTILYCRSFSNGNLLPKYSNKLTILLALSYLLLNNTDTASAELKKANLIDLKVCNYCTELKNFKPKSAFLAGTLSALVPGTGKIYTHNLEHGLVSMFAIGLIGYRTVIEYNSGGIGSAGFIIFGTIFLITYTANIIGSAVSAKLYNKKHYNEIHSKVLDFVNEFD